MQSPASPPTAAQAMRSRDPRSRYFQDRILRVATERTFELQLSARAVGHSCQHALEVVAWRDVEDRKPSQQGRANEPRQSLLSAKIDDFQHVCARGRSQARYQLVSTEKVVSPRGIVDVALPPVHLVHAIGRFDRP